MRCIYHCDMDGRSAAAIVARFTKDYDSNHYIEADYDKFKFTNEMFPEGDTIYIVDYGFNEKTINFLINALRRKCKIIWIDHHIGTKNFLDENREDLGLDEYLDLDIYVHMGRSGALLTWDYLFKSNAPYFIQLISDYDCWLGKYADSNFFKLGMDTYNQAPTANIWMGLFEDMDNRILDNIIAKGKVIWSYSETTNKDLRKIQGYESELDGVPIYVMNREGNSFIFGEEYKNYPAVVLWYFSGKEYIYSIYSDHKVDCEAIASKRGGGGHKYAAGFKTKELILKEK